MICSKSLCKYQRDRGFVSVDCISVCAWSNQLFGLQKLEDYDILR